MKSSEYIMEIIRSMDEDLQESQENLLAQFARDYEEEIRFKVLEMWGMYKSKKP